MGTAAQEILGPNPRRKSFLLSPIAGGQVSGTPIIAVVFGAGVGQPWVVPTGVTQVVTAFVWGSGGNSGDLNGVLGGGGGGGGGFAASGPATAIPTAIWAVDVATGGDQTQSIITPAGAGSIARATSGLNGVFDASGTGGAGSIGASLLSGGDGFAATLLGGPGGGGGGAAGSYHNGFSATGTPGGAGGGNPTLLGIGVGGVGGNAGTAGGPGSPGAGPGGGGGGVDNAGIGIGLGADGEAVIFYLPSDAIGYISLSPRQDVVAGNGVLNFITGQTFPTVISDHELGNAIGLPWWIVSSTADVRIQVVEYLYDEDPNG